MHLVSSRINWEALSVHICRINVFNISVSLRFSLPNKSVPFNWVFCSLICSVKTLGLDCIGRRINSLRLKNCSVYYFKGWPLDALIRPCETFNSLIIFKSHIASNIESRFRKWNNFSLDFIQITKIIIMIKKNKRIKC